MRGGGADTARQNLRFINAYTQLTLEAGPRRVGVLMGILYSLQNIPLWIVTKLYDRYPHWFNDRSRFFNPNNRLFKRIKWIRFWPNYTNEEKIKKVEEALTKNYGTVDPALRDRMLMTLGLTADAGVPVTAAATQDKTRKVMNENYVRRNYNLRAKPKAGEEIGRYLKELPYSDLSHRGSFETADLAGALNELSAVVKGETAGIDGKPTDAGLISPAMVQQAKVLSGLLINHGPQDKAKFRQEGGLTLTENFTGDLIVGGSTVTASRVIKDARDKQVYEIPERYEEALTRFDDFIDRLNRTNARFNTALRIRMIQDEINNFNRSREVQKGRAAYLAALRYLLRQSAQFHQAKQKLLSQYGVGRIPDALKVFNYFAGYDVSANPKNIPNNEVPPSFPIAKRTGPRAPREQNTGSVLIGALPGPAVGIETQHAGLHREPEIVFEEKGLPQGEQPYPFHPNVVHPASVLMKLDLEGAPAMKALRTVVANPLLWDPEYGPKEAADIYRGEGVDREVRTAQNMMLGLLAAINAVTDDVLKEKFAGSLSEDTKNLVKGFQFKEVVAENKSDQDEEWRLDEHDVAHYRDKNKENKRLRQGEFDIKIEESDKTKKLVLKATDPSTLPKAVKNGKAPLTLEDKKWIVQNVIRPMTRWMRRATEAQGHQSRRWLKLYLLLPDFTAEEAGDAVGYKSKKRGIAVNGLYAAAVTGLAEIAEQSELLPQGISPEDMTRDEAIRRLQQLIADLEEGRSKQRPGEPLMTQFYEYGGVSGLKPSKGSFSQASDLGWLLSGLTVAHRTLEAWNTDAELANRITAFIDSQDPSSLFDSGKKQFYAHRDPNKKEFSKTYLDNAGTDAMPLFILATERQIKVKKQEGEGANKREVIETLPRDIVVGNIRAKIMTVRVQIPISAKAKRNGNGPQTRRVRLVASPRGTMNELLSPYTTFIKPGLAPSFEQHVNLTLFHQNAQHKTVAEFRSETRSELRTQEMMVARAWATFLRRTDPRIYQAYRYTYPPMNLGSLDRLQLYQQLSIALREIERIKRYQPPQGDFIVPIEVSTDAEQAEQTLRELLPKLLVNPKPGEIYTAADLRPGEEDTLGDLDSILPYIEGKPVVLGAAGFIGSALAKRLEAEESVVAVIRSRKRMANLNPIRGSEKVFLLELGNLESQENEAALEKLVQHTGTIYLTAAQPDAKADTVEKLKTTIKSNVALTIRVALLAQEYEKKLVYGSSAHIYTLAPLMPRRHELPSSIDESVDITEYMSPEARRFVEIVRTRITEYEKLRLKGDQWVPPLDAVVQQLLQDLEITEEADFSRLPEDLRYGFYALSKIIPEQGVLAIKEGKGIVLRQTNGYGPGMREGNFPMNVIRRIQQGKPVFASDHTRDFIDVDDGVHAMIEAGRQSFTTNQLFLVGSDEGVLPMKTVLDEVVRQMAPEVSFEVKPHPPLLQLPHLDFTKANEVLFQGYKKTSLKDGIQKLIQAIDPPRSEVRTDFIENLMKDYPRLELLAFEQGISEAGAAKILSSYLESQEAKEAGWDIQEFEKFLQDLILHETLLAGVLNLPLEKVQFPRISIAGRLMNQNVDFMRYDSISDRLAVQLAPRVELGLNAEDYHQAIGEELAHRLIATGIPDGLQKEWDRQAQFVNEQGRGKFYRQKREIYVADGMQEHSYLVLNWDKDSGEVQPLQRLARIYGSEIEYFFEEAAAAKIHSVLFKEDFKEAAQRKIEMMIKQYPSMDPLPQADRIGEMAYLALIAEKIGDNTSSDLIRSIAHDWIQRYEDFFEANLFDKLLSTSRNVYDAVQLKSLKPQEAEPAQTQTESRKPSDFSRSEVRAVSPLGEGIKAVQELRFDSDLGKISKVRSEARELQGTLDRELVNLALDRLGIAQPGSASGKGYYVLSVSHAEKEEALALIRRLVQERPKGVKLVLQGSSSEELIRHFEQDPVFQDLFQELIKQENIIFLTANESLSDFVSAKRRELRLEPSRVNNLVVGKALERKVFEIAAALLARTPGGITVVSHEPIEGARRVSVFDVMTRYAEAQVLLLTLFRREMGGNLTLK